MLNVRDAQIGVIGLGYVGLPLAVEFSNYWPTVGYDISPSRIKELKAGRDSTLEVDSNTLAETTQLTYTDDSRGLANCNVYIVTVPTPIDEFKQPVLTPLREASRTVAQTLQKGNVVIYESTVYPGCTEEVCVPILETESGLRLNQDFLVGYSPERINPGDKQHNVTTIQKVTSASTPEATDFVDALYAKIVQAGTHKVSSIRVAEAAKVIENTQRDVNIALINELAMLFNRLDIDTLEVLEAAATKWNFLPFKPGLVGGHCIGVDPYYLTHKAQAVGHLPEIILAGRRLNDGMGPYVAERVVKLMTQRRIHVVDANILILGLAFKENCPDLRNSRVVDVIHEFENYHAHVSVHDPWVNPADAQREYGVELLAEPQPGRFDAIILSVAHREFIEMGAERIRQFGRPDCVLFDVKSALPRDLVDGRL